MTDAGPGVGVSHYEVGFGMAETSRLHKTIRRTRVHRSRGDSAQNESKRTNACVREALVDGGSLHWQYCQALEVMSMQEVESLTIGEITELEEKCT